MEAAKAIYFEQRKINQQENHEEDNEIIFLTKIKKEVVIDLKSETEEPVEDLLVPIETVLVRTKDFILDSEHSLIDRDVYEASKLKDAERVFDAEDETYMSRSKVDESWNVIKYLIL